MQIDDMNDLNDGLLNNANLGLCMWRGRLVYGYQHGRLAWLPRWAKRVIVAVWDSAACAVLGHDKCETSCCYTVCIHCGKELE